MRSLLPLLLLALCAVPARADGFGDLLKKVSTFLNASKKAPRHAAVAAVRGGIPTDQGENLDGRLLDRAAALRAALRNPDASARDEKALRPIYEALAASQYVQALSVPGAVESKADAASALADWAKLPHEPGVPAGVLALLSGPAARIDDQSLVKAGWGRHARLLAPAGASVRPASPGWTSSEEAAKLDETLKGLSDSWLERKLEPEQAARAHYYAGMVYAALAAADLKGRAPAAGTPASAAAVPDDGPAPAEAAVAFEPKAIYQRASKSVVLIVCASEDGTGELGTGSVVDSRRRRILTNAHVVIRDSSRRPWERVSVYFKPAKLTGDPKRDMADGVSGKVVAWDSGLDLALVEVERLPSGTGEIALGRPDNVEIGDRVAAIGHPEQGGLWTLTTGVISTLLADLGGVKGKDAFQTDTSINRGNSGGPLLDASGRLVGVNTSMSRKAADGLAITSINFAVRSDVARRWMAGQGETLAWGSAAAPPMTAAAAKLPDPVPAPAPAAPAMLAAAAPAPMAAPKSVARAMSAPAPAPRKAKVMMLTESKPFTFDAVIDAEVEKMEALGDEMHEEIKRRSGR